MMVTALLAATVLLAQAAAANPPPAAPAPAPPVLISASRDKQPPQPNTVSPVVLHGDKKTAWDPNKIVCRNEPVLGSRMAVKRCTTVGQAEMAKFEAQQDLAKMQAKDGFHH